MNVRSIARWSLALPLLLAPAAASAQAADPRVGLRAGWTDAESAASNMRLVSNTPRPERFYMPGNPGDFFTANSDLAFRGNLVFVGNFSGFQIFDVSDPAAVRLRTAVLCPGGQGDLSVHGNLLFMSVEMPNGRIDCGTDGAMGGPPSPDRFLGVRVFDISNLDQPRQVAAVQTCRGSHTHTLVTSPNDPDNVYVYVQGAAGVRPAAELAGCEGGRPDQNPNTALFRIEVIQVPLAAPQNARVVGAPRIFADRETGAIAGLWAGGAHGEGSQQTAVTDQCHDITTYPELGLAAGACSGNGILLDISDPANPVRIDEVVDPNFAYWHSATFNNDGTSVIFTDEWGGGMAPRCRVEDPETWGANALFHLKDRKLEFAGYYKLPAPQTATENCVAHNGSLVPVPGRDIKVQAWYQGGVSVFDFTDPANAVEIAFFDRGPVSADQPHLGGQWSTYWYNGRIYGSEIGRGLDILELLPSEHLSANEIEAARLVQVGEFNPQLQARISWPAHVVVARAYLDQLGRSTTLAADRVRLLGEELTRAEGLSGEARTTALRQLAASATRMSADAEGPDVQRLLGMAETLRGLAGM
jgi:hypothetical protein